MYVWCVVCSFSRSLICLDRVFHHNLSLETLMRVKRAEILNTYIVLLSVSVECVFIVHEINQTFSGELKANIYCNIWIKCPLSSNYNLFSDPSSEIQKAKFTENQNIAQGHKKRNLTSNIFSVQPPAQPDRPTYDRKNISNVF